MTSPFLETPDIAVYNTDAHGIPRILGPKSVDALVTDPPYELGLGTAGRVSRWDSTGIAFDRDFWASMLDVAKPGAYLLAFGGTRTWHRLACAIEDAGWTICDQLAWLYASGMPKGEWSDHAVDRALGNRDTRPVDAIPSVSLERRAERVGEYRPADGRARAWSGFNPALKPSWEPVIVARRPWEGTQGANLLEYGCGALNVAACAIPEDKPGLLDHRYERNSRLRDGDPRGVDTMRDTSTPRPKTPRLKNGRYPSNLVVSQPLRIDADAPRWYFQPKATDRPVVESEPVLGPRDPGSEEWRTACSRLGLRTDADEYPASTLDADATGLCRGLGERRLAHPTVKPLDLMRWLVRLACPPGGVVLDPFAGTGTTLQAARVEGMRAVGAEYEPDYLPLIRRRLATPVQTVLF